MLLLFFLMQFCGLAVIETKNRAMAIVEKLEQQMDFPKKIRIHWTGCPNSCGQAGAQSILPLCMHAVQGCPQAWACTVCACRNVHGGAHVCSWAAKLKLLLSWLLQVQVADIGLMGGPAKLNGKATEGVRIFLGGSIGEGAQLASEFEKGIACDESILLPKLREIMMERFGAVPKAGVLVEA